MLICWRTLWHAPGALKLGPLHREDQEWGAHLVLPPIYLGSAWQFGLDAVSWNGPGVRERCDTIDVVSGDHRRRWRRETRLTRNRPDRVGDELDDRSTVLRGVSLLMLHEVYFVRSTRSHVLADLMDSRDTCRWSRVAIIRRRREHLFGVCSRDLVSQQYIVQKPLTLIDYRVPMWGKRICAEEEAKCRIRSLSLKVTSYVGKLQKTYHELHKSQFAKETWFLNLRSSYQHVPYSTSLTSLGPIMALLSNHHCNYRSTQSDMLTPAYPNSGRSYDPLYPSPYNSPNYDSSRIAYRDNSTHESELTPRREIDTLDYTKESVSEYAKTPEGYDRVSYGVLTPVTPQR